MKISTHVGYWSSRPAAGRAGAVRRRGPAARSIRSGPRRPTAATPGRRWPGGDRAPRTSTWARRVSQLSARPSATLGHGGDDDGPPHQGPGHHRGRHEQPAGGGGLVRPALSPPAGAHPRVHRHPARGHRAARSRSSTTASTISCRWLGRDPAWASRCVPSCTRTGPRSPSTSARKAPGTSRWRPRSPTGGSPCSSRPP